MFGVHNATYGPFWDIAECVLGHCGVETTPSKLLKETWDDCYAADKKHILHMGHSQGMIHTKNTVPSYDNELIQRIQVIGIAPGVHVKDYDFGEVVHLESTRDFIPIFDKILHPFSQSDWGQIMTLEPHPNAPFIDHFIDSPTYTIPLQARVDSFTQTVGTQS